MLNAKRAAGLTVSPTELEAAYGAEMDALTGKQMQGRQLGIQQASLDETKRMNDVNAELKRDEIAAQEKGSTLGAVSNVAMMALMGKSMGLWGGKPGGNPTDAVPLSSTPEGAAAIKAGTGAPGSTPVPETPAFNPETFGRTQMNNVTTSEVIPEPIGGPGSPGMPEYTPGPVEQVGGYGSPGMPEVPPPVEPVPAPGIGAPAADTTASTVNAAIDAEAADAAAGALTAEASTGAATNLSGEAAAGLSASYAGEGAAAAGAEAGASITGGIGGVLPYAWIPAVATAGGMILENMGGGYDREKDSGTGLARVGATFQKPFQGPGPTTMKQLLGKEFAGDNQNKVDTFLDVLNPGGAVFRALGCIIVTACTSPDSPEVNVTRRYRDSHMDNMELRGYYIVAEKIVPWMNRSPAIRRFVKWALVDGIIDYCEYAIGDKKTLPRRWSAFIMKSFLGVCGYVGSRRPSFVRSNGEVF
jgi:hypothetical protein